MQTDSISSLITRLELKFKRHSPSPLKWTEIHTQSSLIRMRALSLGFKPQAGYCDRCKILLIQQPLAELTEIIASMLKALVLVETSTSG